MSTTPRQHVKTPESFVSDLASVIYTPENIERANVYVRSRGLDPTLFTFPWAATDTNFAPFERFRNLYPPIIFAECLYIPLPEIASMPGQPQIAGFDIRYQGTEPHRYRWGKRKRTPQTELFYNAQAALKGDAFIVTESAIDAESFRTAGWEACAALTARHDPRFVYFLYALGKRIYLALDNDEGGQKARDKVLELTQAFPTPAPVISPLVYPYKDPNEFLRTAGLAAFRSTFEYQLI